MCTSILETESDTCCCADAADYIGESQQTGSNIATIPVSDIVSDIVSDKPVLDKPVPQDTYDADRRSPGRPKKTEGFADQLSTGRRRAGREIAILPGTICEWAWKSNVGGGVDPLEYGCTGREAENIHHGPDKSTLNNDLSNVSRVCSHCHNRWHGRNNKYYHKPRPADGLPWLPEPPPGKVVHAMTEAVEVDRSIIVIDEIRRGKITQKTGYMILTQNINYASINTEGTPDEKDANNDETDNADYTDRTDENLSQ
jgi:hypothetical protein